MPCLLPQRSSSTQEAGKGRLIGLEAVLMMHETSCSKQPHFVLQASVSYRYDAMRAALNKTGRAITYSMCEWGVSNPWLYGQKVRPQFTQ